MPGQGDGTQDTELGPGKSIKEFESLLDSPEFWDSDSVENQNIKQLGRFFPVRYRGANYTRYCYNMLPFNELNDLVVYGSRLYGSKDSTGHINKLLTENGLSVIRRYTSGTSLSCFVNTNDAV